MTDDGTFRVITARTTETVAGALRAQGIAGPTARYLAALVTGVVLIRETMAPQLRVQGILKGARKSGTLVADSNPTGQTRALVSSAAKETGLDIGDGAILQLMRTLHDGRLHQGIVEVPEPGGISEALMAYMQASEQVTTMVAVGTVFDGDDVTAAGGYLVQLLPGAERGPVAIMTERLVDFTSIDERLAAPAFVPAGLMEDLLYGMPFTWLGDSQVRFECWCSQTGVLGAMSTLPRTEVQQLVDEGEVLEISCDYCNREYRIAPAELRGLLEES